MPPHDPTLTGDGAPPREARLRGAMPGSDRAMRRHDAGSVAAVGRDAGLKTAAPGRFGQRLSTLHFPAPAMAMKKKRKQ